MQNYPMSNATEEILSSLKKLQRIPPGTPDFLEIQKKIMSWIGGSERSSGRP